MQVLFNLVLNYYQMSLCSFHRDCLNNAEDLERLCHYIHRKYDDVIPKNPWEGCDKTLANHSLGTMERLLDLGGLI